MPHGVVIKLQGFVIIIHVSYNARIIVHGVVIMPHGVEIMPV